MGFLDYTTNFKVTFDKVDLARAYGDEDEALDDGPIFDAGVCAFRGTAMDAFTDDQILLFVFHRLQPRCEVSDLPLDRQHIAFIRDIDNAMNVERHRLIRYAAKLVREAVGVPPIILRGERVRSRIFTILLEQRSVFRVIQSYVDVQVSSTTNLVGEGHLIAIVQVFKEAFAAVGAELDHVRIDAAERCEEEKG